MLLALKMNFGIPPNGLSCIFSNHGTGRKTHKCAHNFGTEGVLNCYQTCFTMLGECGQLKNNKYVNTDVVKREDKSFVKKTSEMAKEARCRREEFT